MSHIPCAYSDEDGVLFGESSERRIFLPGSNRRNAAIAEDVHGAQQSPPGASRTRTDPLSTLGLLPPSPYVVLRQNVPQTAAVAAAAAANKDKDEAVTTTKSPSSPPGSAYDAVALNNPTLAQRLTTVETSFRRKGGVSSSRSSYSDEAAQETVSFEEIYSPQRLRRAGGGRLKGAKSCEKRLSTSTSSVRSSGRIHDTCSLVKPALENFGRDSSTVKTVQKMRLNGYPMAEEATRLRREADPAGMLRRFWRHSGLPLDHIFATAARVYRRSRLHPTFSTWHSFAKKETHRTQGRAKAAHTIQSKVRVLLARRTAERRRGARGCAAVASALVLRGGFRAHQARVVAVKRGDCQREGKELREPQRDTETAQEKTKEAVASTVIQAAWRAAVGRAEGVDRARRRLKEVLVELGGGQGRMHRIQDCVAPGACLEHVALARACEVTLRLPAQCKGQSREVLLLLLRCRLVLIARRQLREAMRERWERQAEAFKALKAGLDKAWKEGAFRQGQSRREQDQARAKKLRQREREVRVLYTENKLWELSERQRLEAETFEERGREQRESYLMWREETRQYDITKQARATIVKRELDELVMMRREELLMTEAWALEDAAIRQRVVLQMHRERISRLFRPASPCSAVFGGQRRDENDEKVHPSARRATDAQKPEAVVIDRMDYVVDGRKVKATVALRPSDAALVVFKQATALRVTVRDQDVARERVAHWGARCRVDAEHAARVRGELFRLRCKTRKERREKAADVAAMTAVAESSIVQLSAALKEARRATVARAAALADALGVNPPKSLLARRVLNEHSERLVVRDVTAGGCTYHSSPARITTHSAANAKGRESTRVGTGEGPAATTVDRKQRPWQHHHDHRSPPAHAIGSTHVLHPDESSEGLSPPKHTLGEKSCSRQSHTSATEAGIAKTTVGTRTKLPTAGARNDAAAKTALSASSSNALGLGWNREWCRSVDTWCRNASARFRSRLSGEVVSAARRLHWLAGSGRDRDVGVGACGGIRSGSSQSIINYDRDPRGRGKGASAGTCSERSMPSEKVGAEGWAALAAFGDVADLLEIAGSTAELVISVEVGSINLEQPQTDDVCVRQVQDEVDKVGLRVPQDHREGGVVTGKRARSPREDNNLARLITESDSTSAAASSTSEGSINGQETAASALASAEGIVVTRSRESTTAGGVLLHQQDLPLQNLRQYTARAEPGFGKGSDTATRPSPPNSSIFAGTSGTIAVAGTKKNYRRSMPRPPKLTAVDEEADTDTESSSENDQDIADADDTCAAAETAGSRTVGAVRGSRLDAGNKQGFWLDGEPEAQNSEPASQGYREELRSSTTARGLRHDHEKAKGCGNVCTGYLPTSFTLARIILGPAEIEMTLGISSLSAFVLQAARRKQQHLSTRVVTRYESGGAHGTQRSSLNLPEMANALSSPQRARSDIGGKSSSVSREESETAEGTPENRSATSMARSHSDNYSELMPGALSLGNREGTRMISVTEKLGLACAVEALILPHLRIILQSKGRRSTQGEGKSLTPRLRLKLELPQVSTKKDKRASRLDDAGEKSGAQQPPKVKQARTLTATVAPADDHSPEAKSKREPRAESGGETTRESEAIGAVEERNIVWTKRYTEAPIRRWVGRLKGRRCLFSCSTAPYKIASNPSSSGGADPSPRAVGRPRGERGAGRAHSREKVGVDAHSTYVAFIPKRITSHAGEIDHPSSVEAQQHVQVCRAEGIQPPRAWSGRPLCRNCGRRALLRLVVHTNLLAQDSSQSRVCQSQRASLFLPPDKITSNEGREGEKSDIDCGRATPNCFRGRRGHGCPATVTSRGRFGSWVCRSGAILCRTCLGTLRSAEIPLERAAATMI